MADTQLRTASGRAVYPKIEGGGGGGGSVEKNKYGALYAEGDSVNKVAIEAALIHVAKSTMLSVCIEGEIPAEGVEIGVGKGEFDFNDGSAYGNSFMLFPTEIVFGETHTSHGLTLDTLTYISIKNNSNGIVSKLEIVNGYGDTYTNNSFVWRHPSGKPFAKNYSLTSSVHIKLSYYLCDINQPIWLMGDSYMGYTGNARWLYYPAQANYTNWLLNAKGGYDAADSLVDLNNLLNICKTYPSVILWGLGMNHAGDENGQVNSAWMAATNSFLEICTQHNIVPVFTTIPSLPNIAAHTKTALNNWIRNSGYRYVDFAKAMGDDDPSGNCRGWGTDEALLASKANGDPDVHPTARGALELYRQALIDFPEISIGL